MSEGSEATAPQKLFGVIAEVEGRQKEMVMLKLPFGRLIDEVVVPYDTDQPFFLDGVPVTRAKIGRIKIIEMTQEFSNDLGRLTRSMTVGSEQKLYGDQYHTRFEHILRTRAVDVTAQVLKAYTQAVKPSLKDYLPKRQELIAAATQVFIEAMKTLAR